MAKQFVIAGAAACALAAFYTLSSVQPAEALTMKECSAKYQAAKEAGKLGDMKWNDFRAKECGSDSSAAAPATTPAAKPATDKSATIKPMTAKPAVAKDDEEPPAPTRAAPSGMKFPKAVSAKYSSESPGKGRMHTCLDAYNDAKDKNALNGMKWIEKGGGYYSLCNASLKTSQ